MCTFYNVYSAPPHAHNLLRLLAASSKLQINHYNSQQLNSHLTLYTSLT